MKASSLAMRAGEAPPVSLDASYSGFWRWDPIAPFKLWPPRTLAIFGLGHATPMSRQLFVRLLHPDDLPRHDAAWAAAVDPQGGGVFELTYRITRANDGAERWIHANACIEFEDGHPASIIGALRDITAARYASDAYRESARQKAVAIDRATAAIAMFDREMRYLAVSAKWIETFGLDSSPIGRSHYEIFPEIPFTRKAVHARCLVGATEQSDGEAFRRADGSVQSIKWSVRPWFDARDDIGGILISSEELSPRDAPQAEPGHYAALVTSATDAIISKSLGGVILSWNTGASRLFGYRPGEMIGQSITRLIPSEIIEEEARILARIRDGQRIDHYETVRLDNVGGKKDVSLTISPIHDSAGKVIAASKIVRDITARKRVERALRQNDLALRLSGQSLRHAVEAGRLTYVDLDLETQQVRVADNFAHVMGYAPAHGAREASFAEAIPRFLAHVALADQRRVLTAFDDIFAGKSNGVVEFGLTGDDGALRWIEATWDVASLDGKPMRAFITGQDVTSLVADRNAIAAGKAEAERANVGMSKFFAAASHDLRQPVQSLVLLTSALDRQTAKGANTAEIVKALKVSVDGLRRLFAGILDISRLDAGTVSPIFESVDLGSLICRLGDEYAVKAEAKGLGFRVVPRWIRVRTDPLLLERALRNLIENALRYTIEGGVLLGLRRHGGLVEIIVVDTGIGIAPDKQSKIFEEFVQLGNAACDPGQGLGLGLAIVKGFAETLGLEVGVTSRLGRGSRFSLSLAVDEVAAGATQSP